MLFAYYPPFCSHVLSHQYVSFIQGSRSSSRRPWCQCRLLTSCREATVSHRWAEGEVHQSSCIRDIKDIDHGTHDSNSGCATSGIRPGGNRDLAGCHRVKVDQIWVKVSLAMVRSGTNINISFTVNVGGSNIRATRVTMVTNMATMVASGGRVSQITWPVGCQQTGGLSPNSGMITATMIITRSNHRDMTATQKIGFLQNPKLPAKTPLCHCK